MASNYRSVKAAAIDLVDDFSPLDITADYGDKYSAKTKLPKIGVSGPVLAVMPPRFNKVMRKLVGDAWQPVGSIDLVACETIGDVILLACGQSGTVMPVGEPT